MASGRRRREPRPTPGVSRRSFLKGAAGAGAVASGSSPSLIWCSALRTASPTRTPSPAHRPRSGTAPLARTIEGFTTDFSVAPRRRRSPSRSRPRRPATASASTGSGGTAGTGARHIADLLALGAAAPEPAPARHRTRPPGLIDCGNWATSAIWTVPANAVSGVYYALFERLDGGASATTPCSSSAATGPSDILVRPPTPPGRPTTRGAAPASTAVSSGTRAYKVSYNRPADPGLRRERLLLDGVPARPLARAQRLRRRVLRRHRHAPRRRGRSATARCSSPRATTSTGRARSAPTSKRRATPACTSIFMTGNEVFWKIRFEPSIDGDGHADRTLVCYKETLDNAKIDPNPEWTGTWRDPRFSPPAHGGARPRTPSPVSCSAASSRPATADLAIKVPCEYSPPALLAQHRRSPTLQTGAGRAPWRRARSATSSTSTSTTATGPPA